MRILFPIFAILLTTLSAPSDSASHDKAAKPETDNNAVISGTVSVNDTPAAGITVAVMSGPALGGTIFFDGSPPVTTTMTDGTGHFRLSGLAAGSYQVIPLTPVMVAPGEDQSAQPGKSITLAAGEVVKGISINLVPGGVITGKVTTADGAPVIEAIIALTRIVDASQRTSFYNQNFEMFQTDDRGVYRIYGVPAGRYEVSTGVRPKSEMVGGGGAYRNITYYPGVTDEAQAKLIEVTAGGETSNIDITVGKTSHAFAVSGHVIYAGTGQPASGVQIGYGTVQPTGESLSSFGSGGSQSGNDGGFRLEGFLPGHYFGFAIAHDSSYYSNTVMFDISDTDVSGLEIKLNRGGSINGTVVIDGMPDPATTNLLSQITLFSDSSSADLAAPNFFSTKVNSDGSFHIDGIHPGLVQLNINSIGFSLVRIEQGGAPVTGGIQVDSGADIQGVKVVVAYGTGAIQGTITIVGGTLPPGTTIMIQAQRLVDGSADGPSDARYEQADARGRFLMQNLLPGRYELTLSLVSALPLRLSKPPSSQKQTVTVKDSATADTNFILNLGGQPQ